MLGLVGRSDGGLTITQIARELDIPKSSVANLLGELEYEGFIERTGDGFSLGQRLVELAGTYLLRNEQVSRFLSSCPQLPVASDETLLLAKLDGPEVVYLARHDGTQPIRLASDIGKRLPAHVTGLGQAMLSTLEEPELTEILSGIGEYPVLTANSYRDEGQLRAALNRAREVGYAVDDELNTVGIQCYARPLPRDLTRGERYAVSCTMIKARVTDELREGVLADLATLTDLMT